MRVTALLAVFVLIGAILWRPESRAVPSCRTLILILLCVLVLSGCGPRAPTETFATTQCSARDTGEWRTRIERGSCIARAPTRVDRDGDTHGGQCLVWSQDTIHERMQAVSCSKERWVRR